jgi:prolyl 4-hydroxylase
MKINNLGTGIVEIENFISHDEIDEFISVCNSSKEEDWYIWGKGSAWHGNILMPFPIMDIFKVLDKRVSNLFSSYSKIHPLHSIHRLREGQNLPYHSDNGASHERTENIIYGIVLYLNNDFSGGELDYWGLGVSYTPRPGSLVIHLGGLRHGIKEVTSGTRYMITSFIEGDEKKPAVMNLEKV